MEKKKITKESIVAEYLAGGTSHRKLGSKYGIPFSTIRDWVHEFQGRKKTWRDRKKKKKLEAQQVHSQELSELPKDVKALQAALRKSELHNKLLEEMLRLSEEHTGIDLRKKFGTKRS